jgi:beta-phosphoglucomutase-like phosphatase (HAD superfamily)
MAGTPLHGEKPIKGVIFDLDGTLLDTELLSIKAINSVLQEKKATQKATWTVEQHLGIIGMKGADWTKIVLKECGISARSLKPAELETKWEEVLGTMVGEAEALPGTIPSLCLTELITIIIPVLFR